MTVREHRSGDPSCSFCGKTQEEVRRLIAGPDVYVCDECIALCNDIILAEGSRDPSAGEAGREERPSAPARPVVAALARLACVAAEVDVRCDDARQGDEAARADVLRRAAVAQLEATVDRLRELLDGR